MKGGRRNGMDKGPVMGLKEVHPVWSLESGGKTGLCD